MKVLVFFDPKSFCAVFDIVFGVLWVLGKYVGDGTRFGKLGNFDEENLLINWKN